MSKKLNASQIINILVVNFMVVTVGFFLLVAALSSVLASVRSIMGDNTFYVIIEYILGWPILVALMYLLLKFIEKKWFKSPIKTSLYMLFPTLEGVILYSILYFQQREVLEKQFKDSNSLIAFLYIILFFVIIYIINLIVDRIRNKKK